jgi:predicted PurR-regulated permease PerM
VREASDAVRSWRAGEAFTWLSRTPLGSLDITKDIVNSATNVFTWLSSRAFALFGSLTATMLNVVIALFGVYYLLVGGGPLWVRVKRLLPLPQHVSDLLAVRFVEVTEALLLGTVLTAILQGTIVGGAFALFELHPAVFWGFVTACVSVLPLFGSALVWLPGVAILLIEHRVGAAVSLFLVGAVLASNLDNVVRLFLFRRVSGIHPMLTLVGAFAGIRLFGVIGALLGPLILSYLFELLTIYEQTMAAAATPLPTVPDQPYATHRASRDMSESGAQP